MKSKVLFVFLAFMLVVLLFVAACAKPAPAPAKPITLTIADFTPATMFPGVSIDRWAAEVEKRTNGKVKIQAFHGGSLLTSPAMFDGVISNVANCGMSFTSYEPGRFPLLAGMDLPVGFTSARQACGVLWELYTKFKPKELDDFKVLWLDTCAPAYIQSKTPVRNLDDLKGMELRASGTGVTLLKMLGAAGVGMPQSEVAEALAKGVVKGYASSMEVLLDFKYAETVKYVTDYSMFVVTAANVMNKNTWNSLPKDVQKVIDDLGQEQALWTGEYMDAQVKKSLDWAIANQGVKVITLSPEEKAKWDTLLKPAVDKYLQDTAAKGLPGKDFLDELYKLKPKYAK